MLHRQIGDEIFRVVNLTLIALDALAHIFNVDAHALIVVYHFLSCAVALPCRKMPVLTCRRPQAWECSSEHASACCQAHITAM
jgi:hypothetical protein